MEAAVWAALAGVLGIVLGRVWDFRLEAARWRRDQRIRVYEDLAAAYYAAREPLRALAMSEPGTSEAEVAVIRVLEIGVAWNRGLVATWLHGSPPVTAAARQFDLKLSRLFGEARSTRMDWEEFARAHRATEEGLEAFIEAVRRELKHPRLDVKLRISCLSPRLSDDQARPQSTSQLDESVNS
jgi:hypothetical protein